MSRHGYLVPHVLSSQPLMVVDIPFFSLITTVSLLTLFWQVCGGEGGDGVIVFVTCSVRGVAFHSMRRTGGGGVTGSVVVGEVLTKLVVLMFVSRVVDVGADIFVASVAIFFFLCASLLLMHRVCIYFVGFGDEF